jgi:lysophospholipase L1-like esterase
MKFSTLRRLFASFVILVVLLFSADRFGSYALDLVVKQSGFRFSELYAGGNSAEIVILGNSRAVNAFYAPDLEKKLGRSVFHLGYNGMSTELCEAIIFDYLDHNKKPSLIILEVTNLGVSNDLIKDIKLYAGLSTRLRSLIQREDPQLNRACAFTHLDRYNSELFLRTLFYTGKSDQAWINSGNIDPDFAINFVPSEEEQSQNLYPITGSNWKALQRLVVKCAAEGIELRLVASPYLPAFRNNLALYDSWVDTFHASLPEADLFYDYTQSLTDSEYFADTLHINRKGSRALLDAMIQDGVFNSESL